ncbi:MAG: hypothetical protein HDR05_02735 [Lachnospiraceae bacterium]|nr:hypothetical protein [Lachnospiraceae bacterium]
MSKLKFDLKEWKEMNTFTNDLKERLNKYLNQKDQYNQWGYLMDVGETFKTFDPDSSEYVWKEMEVYKKIYVGNAPHWSFWDMFDFENLKCENNRLIAYAKTSDQWDKYESFCDAEKVEKWREWADRGILRIAGETDFNFSKGKGCLTKNTQKYEHYRELIENKSESEKLDWCEKRTHSLENFSLMLVPGEMNNIKGRGRDRIDKFIYILDGYFTEREEHKDDKYWHDIFSKAKGKNYKAEYQAICLEVIYEYLALFSNIEDYCEKIYKMDSKMVRDLIELWEKISKMGEGLEDVENYMKLAEGYWQKKHDLIFHV